MPNKKEIKEINITKINQELEEKKEELVKEINENIDAKKEEVLNTIEEKIDTQVEQAVNSKIKDYERKLVRNKNFKIIRRDIVILLLIAFIIYAGYYLYTNNYININNSINNETNSDNILVEKEKKEELDSKYYITNCGYLVDNLFIDDLEILDIFKKDTVLLTDISNSLKLKISYANIKNKEVDDGNIIFTSDDLLNSYKYIFNDNTLTNESFTYNNTRFIYYNNMYLGYSNNKESINIIHSINKSYISNDDLVFELSVARIVESNLINVYNDTTIYGYNGNISDYVSSLSSYKITFSKYQDNYYFSKLELMK